MFTFFVSFCLFSSVQCSGSLLYCFFFFSSRRRHTRCALVTGVQTCALPISTPIVVPHQALAVTGQVEGGAVLPIGAEHRRHTPALAARPEIEREDLVGLHVPGAAGRRRLRVTGTVQAKHIFPAILGDDAKEREGPRHTDQPPAPLRLSEAERGLGHVRLEGARVGADPPSPPAAPLLRSSGTRSKATPPNLPRPARRR